MHLIITDSGLGGLSVCAELDRRLRTGGRARDVRITYVNAWPERGAGYNSLPDMPARAAAFDRALASIAAMGPDLVLIACNTLSVVYEHTAFHRAPSVPVQGILEAGVDLFYEALRGQPASSIVLLGTRTTIESGTHRNRLIARGVAGERVSGTSCHGLAAAIEQSPDHPEVTALIDSCMERASDAGRTGEPLFAGLCCTHYGMVSDRIVAALARHTGRTVLPLDPNERLVSDVLPRLMDGGAPGAPGGASSIAVVSKVELGEAQRGAVGRLIERVSAPTAAALQTYRHVPDLF